MRSVLVFMLLLGACSGSSGDGTSVDANTAAVDANTTSDAGDELSNKINTLLDANERASFLLCECAPPAERAACEEEARLTESQRACYLLVARDEPAVGEQADCFIPVSQQWGACIEAANCVGAELTACQDAVVEAVNNCPELDNITQARMDACQRQG
jgi:hypothetical protein